MRVPSTCAVHLSAVLL